MKPTRLPLQCLALFTALLLSIRAGAEGPPYSLPDPEAADGTAMQPFDEYGKRLKAARTVGPLTSDLFGDQVSLYNGGTEFVAVDIDVPGNNALPVQLRRRLKIEERKNVATLGGFAEWDFDVPHLRGTFSISYPWLAGGTTPGNRCSNVGRPPVPLGPYDTEEVWHGNFMHLPGQGDQEMLANDQPKMPDVADAENYPWITKNFTMFRCKPTTANGYPGQGFIARTPDGLTYTFDHGIEKDTTTLRKAWTTVRMRRKEVWLLATRVEDRFGNWVSYQYDGDRLISITADNAASSDPRSITLTYSNSLIQSATVNDMPSRTWQYRYTPSAPFFPQGTLESILLPDGSTWQFSYLGSMVSQPGNSRQIDRTAGYQPTCNEPWQMASGSYELTITHPSKAQGKFRFGLGRHYRAVSLAIEQNCRDESSGGLEQPYETMPVPHYSDSWTLGRKTITGPGLPTMTWEYDFSGADPAPSCGNDCQNDKTVTVTQPDGSKKQEIYGVRWSVNEGRLLGQKTLAADGTVLERSEVQYMEDSSVPAQPFADVYGQSLNWGFDPVSTRIRPITKQTIYRDDADFATTNSAFDAFARAGQMLKASSLGFSRTQGMGYHDNLALWLLAQQKRSIVNGTVASENTFDANTAQLLTRSSFGVRDASFTYHPDGALASIKDGNDQITRLDDWYLGVPRLITFPDTRKQSSTVNDSGWIVAVTDPLLATTHYTYDGMGRTTGVVHPSGDSVVWNATQSSFVSSAAGAFGLPGGHWKQTVTTGAARTTTYFDGYWRPLAVMTEDIGNISTRSIVVKRYDSQGREIFSSYPISSLGTIDDTLPGIRTFYDALDRVTRVEQDSEQGVLVSTTEYLSGLRVRNTNPRNFATTTSYQAYDMPSYDTPLQIAEPGDVNTAIVRDGFGKPLTVTRSGPSG